MRERENYHKREKRIYTCLRIFKTIKKKKQQIHSLQYKFLFKWVLSAPNRKVKLHNGTRKEFQI